jgi:hypothetical protein
VSIIQRQLEHGIVWCAKEDMSPLDGLARAAAAADPDTLATWGAENLSLLTASDVSLRTMAVAALSHLPVAARDVLHLLETRPDLYRDVEAQGHPLFPRLLDHALYVQLARGCHPDALPALRERLRAQPSLAVLMARKDGEWLVEHASLVTRDVLGGVLRGLPEDQRPRLLRNMAPWDDALEVLQQPWWQGLADVEALRRIVARG